MIQVTKRILIPPIYETCFGVITKHDCSILVYLDSKVITKRTNPFDTGVSNVPRDEPFKCLVHNFGTSTIKLCPGQRIVKDAAHPANLVESQTNHGEIFGLISDTPTDGKFNKHNIDPRNIHTINKDLVDQCESHRSADEKLTTSKAINIDVRPSTETSVRDTLRKGERICSGQLGEINAMEPRFHFKPDANKFTSPPYRAVPKTRELEQSDISK